MSCMQFSVDLSRAGNSLTVVAGVLKDIEERCGEGGDEPFIHDVRYSRHPLDFTFCIYSEFEGEARQVLAEHGLKAEAKEGADGFCA